MLKEVKIEYQSDELEQLKTLISQKIEELGAIPLFISVFGKRAKGLSSDGDYEIRAIVRYSEKEYMLQRVESNQSLEFSFKG